MSVLEKAQRIIDAGNNLATQSHSQIDAIQLFEGFAEPGYRDPESGLIALGNWNAVTEYRHGKFVPLDETPVRVGKLLERLGVELEWSDEWMACDHCLKLFRVKPNSYRWQQSGVVDDNGSTCANCLNEDPTDYLESLEGHSDRCNTIESINPEDHGYVLIKSGFEHGFYGHQDADPHLIAQALDGHGIERFLFNLDSTGQFDMAFSVYLHKSERSKLRKARKALETEKTDGPSVVAGLCSALSDASRKMIQLQGDGIRYANCKAADGTAEVRLISPEEFVRGIGR